MIWEQIMDTWGYLIAIAFLLLLAGVMLYARFSSRANAKALHHQAPGEWSFHPDRIQTAPIAPIPSAAAPDPEEASLRVDRPTPVVEAAPPAEKDYLDELQEAAAGLARLMRSSPVSRTEPVVYEPQDDVGCAGLGEKILQAPAEPGEPALSEVFETVPPVAEVSEAMPVAPHGSPAAEALVPDEEDLMPEMPVEVRTRESLLGEAVWEKLGKIDEALESLDDLVSSLASGLRLLAGGGEEATEVEPAVTIAAAA